MPRMKLELPEILSLELAFAVLIALAYFAYQLLA